VPRFLALRAHWRREPPPAALLAAALRYRPPTAEATPAAGVRIDALMAALPNGRL